MIAHPGFCVGEPLVSSFQYISPNDATLVGAPLSQGQRLDTEWNERWDDLLRASDRLKWIGLQQALLLLRASFGASRVQHLLRSSPSADHHALKTFDDIQRCTLNTIINSDLTDTQWLQATLPVKDGGLGVRRVSSIAILAFLASATSTLSLQSSILSKCQCSTVLFVDLSLASWSSVYG